jgi:hypothetical protein
MKLRLSYAILGPLAFISQNDAGRALERCLRRADAALVLTQGFSPRPRVSFGPARPTGYEAWREVVDLELDENLVFDGPVSLTTFLARLNEVAPAGLVFHGLRVIDERDYGSLTKRTQFADYLVFFEPGSQAAETVAALTRMLPSWNEPVPTPFEADPGVWLLEAGETTYAEAYRAAAPSVVSDRIETLAREGRLATGAWDARRPFCAFRAFCAPERTVRLERALTTMLARETGAGLIEAGVSLIARTWLWSRGDSGLIEVF